jgi:hypothetical protein
MTLLIAAETVLLALLALLVVGLLRSHVEILRRIDMEDRPRGDGEEFDPRIASPTDGELDGPAHEIGGLTLSGDMQKIAFPPGGPGTLVAFLSSGCSLCQEFWDAFANSGDELLPRNTRLVIVTKDPTHESPGKLDRLAPERFPVLMSSSAWLAYEVPVAPYFVYVDGKTGRIQGEGAATRWEQLQSLFTDYLFDREREPARRPATETAGGHRARATRVDAELEGVGVAPDDASLYAAPDGASLYGPEGGEPVPDPSVVRVPANGTTRAANGRG